MMCRLYGFHATHPSKVECELIYSQNALLAQSKKVKDEVGHNDGWGIAYYQDKTPHSIKKAWAAHCGGRFKKAAQSIFSDTVLAHVRRATIGKASLVNSHPFLNKDWAFIHNGSIIPFEPLKQLLIRNICPSFLDSIKGDTDSEHIFYYILSLHKKEPQKNILKTLLNALRQIITWAMDTSNSKAATKVSLNIILTNGKILLGSRYGRPLWYLKRTSLHSCEVCGVVHFPTSQVEGYRSFSLASEPISQEPWSRVPKNSVFLVDDDYKLQIDSI